MYWVRTLDIKEAWQASRDEKISLQKLSEIIAKKLIKFDTEDGLELGCVIEQFQALSEDEDPSVEDFDYAMEDLYNWADTSLDGMFGSKKNCWVELF